MNKGSDDEPAVSRHTDEEAMGSESSLLLFPCTNKAGGVFILNSPILPPVIEVEPTPTNESPISCKTRNIETFSNDFVGTSEIPLPLTPDNWRSPASGNTGACLTPGSVVVDEKVVQECSGSQHAGHVLVQMFGNNRRTFLDPAEDLSQFDHALRKHAETSPGIQSDGCSGELKSSTPPENSYDGGNAPSPSKTDDDSVEGGRGRRKRKLKIHFDELEFEEKPARRLRRLRIMRSLGLVAPAGSPFSLPNGRSA